jgi:hypothetical protein
MPDQQSKALRLVAVKIVLDRLGEQLGAQMFQVLKSMVFHELDNASMLHKESTFSLEEWHKGLQKIVGFDAAEMIMQNVHIELDRLSEKVERRGAIVAA